LSIYEVSKYNSWLKSWIKLIFLFNIYRNLDSNINLDMTYNNKGLIEMKYDASQIKIGDGRKILIQQSGK
jgi:hypothetical protein